MYFHKISDVHYWTENRRVTLGGDGHDLLLNEYGCWECGCEGYHYRHDCEHVRQLNLQLYGPPLAMPAREAVKLRKLTLEQIFELGSEATHAQLGQAPTHQPTRRERVKEQY